MKCPECGSAIGAGDRYCQECGTELPDNPGMTAEDGGGLAASIPLMMPGETGRNIAVGALYVVVFLSVIGAAAPGSDTPDTDGANVEEPEATSTNTGERGATSTPVPDGGTPTSPSTATLSPTPSPTATQTPTASPTATPNPTATPRPDYETQSYSGNGQAVTDTVSIEGGLTTFAMSHDGDSNFQVELIDESTGDTYEFLANEIGSWEADQPYYVPPGDYVLEVEADGNWNIDVDQPRPAPSAVSDLPASSADQYPDYIGPVQFDGLHRVSAQYNGDGNFAVWILDEDGQREELVFNEVGQFEGETTYSGTHVGYIRIEATGDWNIDVE